MPGFTDIEYYGKLLYTFRFLLLFVCSRVLSPDQESRRRSRRGARWFESLSWFASFAAAPLIEKPWLDRVGESTLSNEKFICAFEGKLDKEGWRLMEDPSRLSKVGAFEWSAVSSILVRFIGRADSPVPRSRLARFWETGPAGMDSDFGKWGAEPEEGTPKAWGVDIEEEGTVCWAGSVWGLWAIDVEVGPDGDRD